MNHRISELNTGTPRTQRFTDKTFPILLCDPLRSLCLCVYVALVVLAACTVAHAGTTNDISSYVQRGLFEEEANHNLDAAMQAYQSAVTLHDKDRKLAATAIFRLGECLRKEGKTNEANAYYQRIVNEFADQAELVKLSEQYVGAAKQTTGSPVASTDQSALQAQYRAMAAETAKAEALKLRVSKLAGDELVNFFTTIQPDQLLIDLERERDDAVSKLTAMQSKYGNSHPEVQQQRDVIKLKNERLTKRALTLAWSIEQRYKMLKEQEDALKARLEQTSTSIAKAKESPTTSGEDEEIRKIKEMIQDSPDLINARAAVSNGFYLTPLESAASAGQLKVAQFLVASGAEINPSDGSPLMYAAENGHNAMVEFLLSKGANVNAATGNSSGRTALHEAAQHGFKVVVETLLQHGANVNAREKNGITPLFYAATGGSTPIVELLLANGADVNAKGDDSSPLLQAAERKHADCVGLLVAHKADVNFKGRHGNTPLLAAAKNDDLGCAKILLDNGADMEAQIEAVTVPAGFSYAQNWEEATFRAINFAIEKNDPKLVALLLDHHADPNSTFTWYFDMSRANPGTTPLIMAARHSDNAEIVELLFNHGADVKAPDKQGATALHYAAKNSRTNLAAILLQHGADVNAVDNLHRTPLFYAVEEQEPDTNMVAFLIQHNADVNLANKMGYPPILAIGAPATPQRRAIHDQLLKAGANENFFRLKQIAISRNGQNNVIFLKGSNDWNHFTLLELISVVYGKNVPPSAQAQNGQFDPQLALRSIPPRPILTPGSGFGTPTTAVLVPGSVSSTSFQFPDFAHVKIKRISKSPFQNVGSLRHGATDIRIDSSKSENEYNVNVNDLLARQRESSDIELDWGDIVEIPELDHPINSIWQGISPDTQFDLMDMLKRKIGIKIKEASTNLVVLPPMPICQNTGMLTVRRIRESNKPIPENAVISSFGLRSLIYTTGVLRSSSDTTHIKISRNQNANSGSITVNLNEGEEPWIEPGDTIEIPDRESTEAAK